MEGTRRGRNFRTKLRCDGRHAQTHNHDTEQLPSILMTLKDSLLWPLTVPYGAVSRLRSQAYRSGMLKQQHLAGKVISVANLATGGTGKTPMVIWIAERLAAEGKNVGILTRGYRGH